jgi:hypothetical protein
MCQNEKFFYYYYLLPKSSIIRHQIMDGSMKMRSRMLCAWELLVFLDFEKLTASNHGQKSCCLLQKNDNRITDRCHLPRLLIGAAVPIVSWLRGSHRSSSSSNCRAAIPAGVVCRWPLKQIGCSIYVYVFNEWIFEGLKDSYLINI